MHSALRALSITDPSHRSVFDEEFAKFFEGLDRLLGNDEESPRVATTSVHKPIVETIPEEEVSDVSTQSGASTIENVAARDFANLKSDDLSEARRIVNAMFWQPTSFQTRRWAPDSHGRRPDLRRTLHGAIGPEGDLLAIKVKNRRYRERPLIILADISGSMERYAEMFLVFAHAAQRRIAHVEAFTFSTRLTRITPELRKRDPVVALSNVSSAVTDWSGGTKIGEAVGQWNREWSRRMARGGPVALILSDGWDCGEPETLRDEMARLSRSVHKIVWLNPLAAKVDYQPLTRGMKAVMPYVDHLLPAASVRDLQGVVRLLESINGVRKP
jgi:hypothetical protein